MEKLKTQLFVLRQIALCRPSAHLAFLAHKAYREMYDNLGQNLLFIDSWGHWETWNGYLRYCVRYNNSIFAKMHPFIPFIFIHPPDAQTIDEVEDAQVGSQHSVHYYWEMEMPAYKKNEELIAKILRVYRYIYDTKKTPPVELITFAIDYVNRT